MGNEELSEFKTRTIFGTRKLKVNNRIGVFEENYKKRNKEGKEEHQNNMSEKVDGYLTMLLKSG